MRMSIRSRAQLAAFTLLVLAPVPPAFAQSGSGNPAAEQVPSWRDGQHDFDFEIGDWRTHLRRLKEPLSGRTEWEEYSGTSIVSSIWDGRANMVELDVEGPTGRIVALSLRLYDPRSGQWSLNFANSRTGTLTAPVIGEFRDGRGEFYTQEPFNGRAILVRFVVTAITPDSLRFVQSFSDDGGRTWEDNWIAIDTRLAKREDR